MPVEVLEDTDELFICSGIHGEHKDNIDVALIWYKQLSVSFIGCDWELVGEVSTNTFLGINNIVADLVGACLQFLHWCIL